MPDLAESLQGKDLGHLHIIAALWKRELADQDAQSAILQLVHILLDASNVNAMLTSLVPEVRLALDDLKRHKGRLPWAQFSRNYGEIRQMGPARRDRERPYDNPTSVVEALWYRGLVARAFFDTPAGPEEFAYIPDDLLVLFPTADGSFSLSMGRPSAAAEYAQAFLANDRILDHACTYLAAIRLGISLTEPFTFFVGEELTLEVLNGLLSVAGQVGEDGMPLSDPVRLFLESERGQALKLLYHAWRHSAQFNELRLLPGLVLEGKWENNPLRTRQAILGWLARVPQATWWSLDSFISAIKQASPDFQRPAGDYDSWFIREKPGLEYLRGFEHWDRVDGRLIRYYICGPLHWLGVLDLACPQGEQEVTAFRLSRWSQALLNGDPPRGLPQEKELLVARSDARLGARRMVPRSIRYQLARFCEWEKETPDEYRYRISPVSLVRARQQGLKVTQLVAMLNRYAQAVPPSLIKALERWDKHGSEARLEKMVVLRVSSDEILQALRKSRASRYLGEPLGSASIAIKPGAVDKVLAVLAELGYLGEIRGTAD
jgi:hypothetical protein